MKAELQFPAQAGGSIFQREGANELPQLVLMEIAITAEAICSRTVDRLASELKDKLTPAEIEAAAIGLSNILGGGWHG